MGRFEYLRGSADVNFFQPPVEKPPQPQDLLKELKKLYPTIIPKAGEATSRQLREALKRPASK